MNIFINEKKDKKKPEPPSCQCDRKVKNNKPKILHDKCPIPNCNHAKSERKFF